MLKLECYHIGAQAAVKSFLDFFEIEDLLLDTLPVWHIYAGNVRTAYGNVYFFNLSSRQPHSPVHYLPLLSQ